MYAGRLQALDQCIYTPSYIGHLLWRNGVFQPAYITIPTGHVAHSPLIYRLISRSFHSSSLGTWWSQISRCIMFPPFLSFILNQVISNISMDSSVSDLLFTLLTWQLLLFLPWKLTFTFWKWDQAEWATLKRQGKPKKEGGSWLPPHPPPCLHGHAKIAPAI